MSVERRSGRKWVIGVVVGLAVLVVAAGVLATPFSRKPVDDYIARVAAAGKPVTVRALLGPDPPPETNGVADVDAAGKWMDEKKGEPDTWKIVGPWNDGRSRNWSDGVTDEQRRAVDAHFADAKPFFDGVAAGLAKPRLRAPTSADGSRDSYEVEVRNRVIHALAARAVGATKADDRLQSAEFLAKLGVRSECRTMFDVYVASSAMDDATLAVRCALARGDVDAAAWRARLDPLLREAWLPRFCEAIRLERTCILDFLQTADLSKPLMSSSMNAQGSLETAVRRIASRLEAFRRGDPVADESPAALVMALERTERFETASTDSYPRLVAEILKFAPPAPPAFAISAIVSYVLRTAQAMASTETSCRLSRIALAAAEHRAKSGEFPASLDELKDAFPDGVPLDPYTDAPFVYERTAGGARLASVGRLPDDSIVDPRYPSDDGFVWVLRR